MRYQIEAPILAHDQLAEFEFEITLHAPEVANEAMPGQFMQIQYDHTYNPFTRRPFSVYRTDREKGTFSIVYLARGVFTQGLRNKQPGQKLSVVGPLGNWFEPDAHPDVKHVLVAGGVGAPPIYLLAERMVNESKSKSKSKSDVHDKSGAAESDFASPNLIVINGARTDTLLVATAELAELGVEVHFTTDDGSHGMKGLVTDALKMVLDATPGPAHVYTCGPTAMLRAVGDMCLSRGVPCQVSVETMMPCGLGVCMGCVVKVKDNSPAGFSYLRSCYEGPVFKVEEIIWE